MLLDETRTLQGIWDLHQEDNHASNVENKTNVIEFF
jgi:hypothetical protein